MRDIEYPTTMAEWRKFQRLVQRLVRCDNCAHWQPHTRRKRWTWGQCDIDGVNSPTT